MNRFENIILERLKRGAIASRPADSEQKSKLKQDFKYGVEAYKFVDVHGRKKFKPYTVQEISEFMPDDTKYYKYENGDYIFVIDEKNSVRETRETIWDVYIVDKKKTFPNIKDDVIVDNSLGMYGKSIIITLSQYNTLMALPVDVPEPVEPPETPSDDLNNVWIDKTQKDNYIPALKKNIDLINNDIYWVKAMAPAGPDKPWHDEANSENDGYFVRPHLKMINRWNSGQPENAVSAENSPYAFILNTWPNYGKSVEKIQGSAARASFDKIAADIIGSNLTKTETRADFLDDLNTIVWQLEYFRLDDENGIQWQQATLPFMLKHQKNINDVTVIYALQMAIRTWLAPVLGNFAEIKNFMKVPITDYGTYGPLTQAVVQKFNKKWVPDSSLSNIPSSKFLNILFRIHDPDFSFDIPSDEADSADVTIKAKTYENGSQNAKDFQELLYQVGLKITPDYTNFKTFAKYRNKGTGGGWSGVIDDITLAALHQLKDLDGNRLTVKWLNGLENEVVKELQKTLGTVSESINYFKGIGLDIKFRDLINEQVTAAEEEAYIGSSTNVSTKSKESSNNQPTDKKPSVKDKPKPTIKKPSVKDKHKLAIKKPSGKRAPKPDTIIRQENGFLTTADSYKRIKNAGTKEFPTNSSGKAIELKNLLYKKNIIVRSGIGKYRDNEWRGYNNVSRDWLTGFDGKISGGFAYRNWSDVFYKNVKPGTKLTAKILDVKYIMGGYWAQPEPRIWTYVYAKSGPDGTAFWVPTTWIKIP